LSARVGSQEDDQDDLQELEGWPAKGPSAAVRTAGLVAEDEERAAAGRCRPPPRVLVGAQQEVVAEADGDDRGDAKERPIRSSCRTPAAARATRRCTTRSCGSRLMRRIERPISRPTTGNRTWSRRAVDGQRQVDQREHAEEHEQGARVADRRSLGLGRGEADPADAEDDGDEDEQPRLSATPAGGLAACARCRGAHRCDHRRACRHRALGRSSRSRTWPTSSSISRPSGIAPGAVARRGASRWCCRGPRRTSSGRGR
jgi:hypothetical protein